MLQFGLFEKKTKHSLVYFILSYTTVDVRVYKHYKRDIVIITKKPFYYYNY